MKPAVTINNVSKTYRLTEAGHGTYHTFAETLANLARLPWSCLLRRLRPAPGASGPDTFWALRDISFDIQPGDVVGVIGRNGAGKSTLLKVLSRITEPSAGRVEVRGRIGSLLEVGTGFHPELTGRENIFLNGSILGMARHEIARKFDEIVAFAEVERFLDTPVKHYSSGMYVRLAFAVASHLEPEILIVDEVLAVGDQAFQKKCLGKMGEVSRSGRTILFVSHNMAAIQNLCNRVAFLDRGRLVYAGPCREGLDQYMNQNVSSHGGEVDLAGHANRRPGGTPVVRAIRLRNGSGELTDQFGCGEDVTIELDLEGAVPDAEVNFALEIYDSLGTRVTTVATFLSDLGPVAVRPLQRLRCELGQLPLAPGRYAVTLVSKPLYKRPFEIVDNAVWFEVVPVDFYGNGRLPEATLGSYLVRSRWTVGDQRGQRGGEPSATPGAAVGGF